MPLFPHRTSPDRVREVKQRAIDLARQQLGGRRLCDRCGATYSTYADKCTANLGEVCPGSRAIEDATAKAQEQARRG